MSKIIKLGFLLLLLSGCSGNGIKSGDSNKLESMDNINRSISLTEKQYDLDVSLIDKRNGEILTTLTPDLFKKGKTDNTIYEQLVSDLAGSIDQPMLPAKLDASGNLVNGQNRVVLNEEEAVKKLANVKVLDKVVQLPIEETGPNVSIETTKGLNEVVIGSYKTKFNPNTTGRTKNINLSSDAINNIVLGPGDRFYFNLVVGERTTERGYQKALEIVNGDFVEGIGGGICQTSSTLYNAVNNAGLEMLELHHHSKPVGYVPINQDATVSWGGPDFKFANNKDYPIMIKMIVDNQQGTLEVQVLTASQFVKV